MGATQTTSESHKAVHYHHTYTLFAQIRSRHGVNIQREKTVEFSN